MREVDDREYPSIPLRLPVTAWEQSRRGQTRHWPSFRVAARQRCSRKGYRQPTCVIHCLGPLKEIDALQRSCCPRHAMTGCTTECGQRGTHRTTSLLHPYTQLSSKPRPGDPCNTATPKITPRGPRAVPAHALRAGGVLQVARLPRRLVEDRVSRLPPWARTATRSTARFMLSNELEELVTLGGNQARGIVVGESRGGL